MRKGLKLIVAFNKKTGGIGYKNRLPWPKITPDIRRFIKLTCSTKNKNKMNSVIMGRKTWDSLPHKPLPNRYNFVISSNMRTDRSDVKVFPNLNSALNYDDDKIEDRYIIGGQQVYKEALKRLDIEKLYTTEIYDNGLNSLKYDSFFPKIPKWYALTESKQVYDNKTGIIMDFNTYDNISDPSSDERQYLKLMDDIIKDGERVGDRTGVGTLSLFDRNLNFGIEVLNPEEEDQRLLRYRVPVLTTKNLFIKGVILELIWFLSGNTDARWLSERGVHIWDGHTSREYLDSIGLNHYEEGMLGPGYGHQWVNWGGDNNKDGINQISNIVEILRKNPESRRAVLSAWNVSDLNKMALPPCHIMYMFKVSNHNEKRKRLNCKMVLRSNDIFLGNPFNILSASILTIIISRTLNMLPGKVAVSICDAHIYTNHIEQAKIQIKRIPLKFPTMRIKKNICEYEDMCKLKYDDFEFEEYYHWPRLKGCMAV